MDDFPLISKEDPADVRAHFVYENWKLLEKQSSMMTSQTPCMVALFQLLLKRESQRRKQLQKLLKMRNLLNLSLRRLRRRKMFGVGTFMPTIRKEAQELEPAKILNRRTRGGNSTGSSQSLPPQPSIP